MVPKELLFIKHNEIELEAEYFHSKSHIKNPAIIICHPHPQYGGNMFNNVVSGVFTTLINNDISCLRFNFRGVGRSNGKFSGGLGEINDVKACIDFLIKEKNFAKVIICGYSFGAAIGCSAINYSNNVIGYVSISFPWDFMGSKYKELSQSKKPKLFIQGNRDTVAHYEKFKENFEYYDDPKIGKIIDGADHFYWGYEEQISNEILNFYHTFWTC